MVVSGRSRERQSVAAETTGSQCGSSGDAEGGVVAGGAGSVSFPAAPCLPDLVVEITGGKGLAFGVAAG
jgi:hypothetical protein